MAVAMPDDRECARRPAPHDLLDALVVCRRDRHRVGIGRACMCSPHSGMSVRSSLICAGVTGVPLFSHATRM